MRYNPTNIPPRLAARPAPEAVSGPGKLVTRASNGAALVGQGGEAPGSLTGKVPQNAAPRELGDRPCHELPPDSRLHFGNVSSNRLARVEGSRARVLTSLLGNLELLGLHVT